MRAVIFDLDGVLVRTDQAHDKAWRALAVRLGIPFDGRAAARLRGVSRMEALDIVLEGCGRSFTPAEKEALAAEKNERYRALIAEMTPADVAPDTTVTLKALRERGLLLAVASSSKNARFILERTGLTPYFHAVVDGTQIARSKPDPEVFLKAAQALGVSPAEALVVEDAAAGVRAAHCGGFSSAAKYGVPVVPQFITFTERETCDAEGIPEVSFTLHIAPPVYPKPELGKKENTDYLKQTAFDACRKIYEETYGIPLTYTCDDK